MNEQECIREWCDRVATDPADWEHLPDLGLYMDQVLTLMESQLAVASDDGSNPVTSSMINNYVKDGVLLRPEKKKYGREHLAVLYMICMMKSQLPLPQIHQLLDQLRESDPTEEVYRAFTERQTQELQKAAEKAQEAAGDRQMLARLAMEMALEGNARHLAAMQILRSLETPETPDKQQAKAEKQAAKAAAKAAKAAKKAEAKATSESEEPA